MAGKQAVPNGAYLLCDKGAKPGKLTVTPSSVSYYGESSATEFDYRYSTCPTSGPASS